MELIEERICLSSPNVFKSVATITTESKLRLRVEQQLGVITTLQCESQGLIKDKLKLEDKLKPLEKECSKLQDKNAKLISEKAILLDRFDTLSANHNEMIAIMKEYKADCAHLRASLLQLQSTANYNKIENEADRSEEINECKAKIFTLIKELKLVTEENRKLHEQLKDYSMQLEETVAKEKRNKLIEYELNKLTDKLEETKIESLKCKSEIVKLVEQNTDRRNSIRQLQTEKEYLNMRNVILFHNFQDATSVLSKVSAQLLTEREKLLLSDEKFKLQSEQILKDKQIISLNKEITDLTEEKEMITAKYISYKKLSQERLNQERDLNIRLRNSLI